MEFVNPAEDFIIFGEDRKLDAARTLEAVRLPDLDPTLTLTLTASAACPA